MEALKFQLEVRKHEA